MSTPQHEETGTTHISLKDEDDSPSHHDATKGSTTPKSSSGWDGKLRIEKKAQLVNPEAISDPSTRTRNKPTRRLPPHNPRNRLRTRARLLYSPPPPLPLHSPNPALPTPKHHFENRRPAANAHRARSIRQPDRAHQEPGPPNRAHEPRPKLQQDQAHQEPLRAHQPHGPVFRAEQDRHHRGIAGSGEVAESGAGCERIREIGAGLEGLVGLEELWLGKNKITEIRGLEGLQKLKILSIQSNRIRDITGLSSLPHLQELYISHNALTSLRGLEECKGLKVLDISNNQIERLEGLEGLEELEEVWASYNMVGDFNEVEKVLGGKKGLNTVYFEGNPLQLRGPAVYRNKVKLALPQVMQIDATFVRVS
ncbi:Protein phosphatase 1 regulatory subunit SDS22 [Lachnellula cervina]|uniref:Protein phosphatase 1 regulatory subunit SDS22 n=1 Tax=Lachnellula cervina TaxID=1316786 RepID=A0A7D8UHH9_9HELO|nr:Protein phosphatase 1 regulatory subunit SDS22 [Lachnellula cervina]